MSQVLVRLHWNGHTTASASQFSGSRCMWWPHIPRPIVPRRSGFVLRCRICRHFHLASYQDRWHARSSWRSWRALREMCWLGHDHLANLTGRPHASRKELHPDLTPSPPRSPGRPTPFPTFCEKPIHLVGLRRILVSSIMADATWVAGKGMRLSGKIGPAVLPAGFLAALFAQTDPSTKSATAILENKCA